jgi:hypothetical protein
MTGYGPKGIVAITQQVAHGDNPSRQVPGGCRWRFGPSTRLDLSLFSTSMWGIASGGTPFIDRGAPVTEARLFEVKFAARCVSSPR